MSERISDAEHAVMEVLWDEAPLSAQDVAERVAPDRGWSANTVKTLLGRLLAKVQSADQESQDNLMPLMEELHSYYLS